MQFDTLHLHSKKGTYAMSNLFQEHLTGCSATKPCLLCEVVQFLKKKLSDADFGELMNLIRRNDISVPSRPAILDSPIETLGFSFRIRGGMKYAEIETLAELLEKTEMDLLRIPNMGKLSVNNIKEILSDMGLRLAD